MAASPLNCSPAPDDARPPAARHPAFTTPLGELKGVGPAYRAALARAGFFTTGDLLALTPKFYQDRRFPKGVADLVPGDLALVSATVVSARARFSPKSRRRYLEAVVEDESGRLTLCWFNSPGYLLKSLPKGRPVKIFGRVAAGRSGLVMAHPDLDFSEDDDAEEKGGLVPVYPAIPELPAALVKKLLAQALELLAGCPPFFQAESLAASRLTDPTTALKTLHDPPSDFPGPAPRPEETRAHRTLATFELYAWRLMMRRARALRPKGPARPKIKDGFKAAERFWAGLPFTASPEQRRVTDEILADLASPGGLSRLLQGEVGGGKTAVAGAALFFTLGRGAQAALMAPTEVLARQHFDFLAPLAEALGYPAVLLVGGQGAAEKKAARQALAEGRARLAVGSQALLSPATLFKNLGLAVIDEQHRFGVRQRLMLRRKNQAVDLLALSATPIPRSLALTLYGDLDHSGLAGLLPGRRPAATEVFQPEERPAAWRRFLELLADGGQAFVVTPRIGEGFVEASGDGDDNPDQGRPRRPSLEEILAELSDLAGPELPIATLHGRLGPAERQAAMDDFRQGRARILLATTIIEVGVDVPDASVMLVEGAENFGLAQLHQLRGRVGRGGQASHCLLLAGSAPTSQGAARLAAMARESDGVKLAELDLELRGPGEQLGLKQSGWPVLRYARLPRDLALMGAADRLAAALPLDLAELNFFLGGRPGAEPGEAGGAYAKLDNIEKFD